MTDRAGADRALETLAPAKVNLALAVIGHRPDGYHELVSIFARIDLVDRLEARTTPREPRASSAREATNGADRLIERITELHSYSVPALAVWPIAKLPAAYGDWVEESVG